MVVARYEDGDLLDAGDVHGCRTGSFVYRHRIESGSAGQENTFQFVETFCPLTRFIVRPGSNVAQNIVPSATICICPAAAISFNVVML